MLYSVRDPGNLGAVIRSAVAFGIKHIILSSDCADIYNSRTVRAAMGSLFKIRITTVSDFASLVSAATASGRRVFAAELTDNAVAVDKVGLAASDIFIIGNEGHGIDRSISALATGSVFIPICPETESLNASVAASVLMWEIGKL
jgi:TrmH family RNA methyltransferase